LSPEGDSFEARILGAIEKLSSTVNNLGTTLTSFSARLDSVELIAKRANEYAIDAKRTASEAHTKVIADLSAAAEHLQKLGQASENVTVAAESVRSASESIRAPVAAIQVQNDEQTHTLEGIRKWLKLGATLALPIGTVLGALAGAIVHAYLQAQGH
jgi:type I site-specific restriction endonuclease